MIKLMVDLLRDENNNNKINKNGKYVMANLEIYTLSGKTYLAKNEKDDNGF